MDRSEGYEPRFDFNLKEGKEGERLVQHTLELGEGAVEVKRKSYRDFEFYVEASHSPSGYDGYKPSGIEVTEAKWWAYVVESTGVIMLVAVDRLRWAFPSGRFVEEQDGDCPTKGRMVGAWELFPEYETYGLEEVCGQCGGSRDVGPAKAISDGAFAFLCQRCWWAFAMGRNNGSS